MTRQFVRVAASVIVALVFVIGIEWLSADDHPATPALPPKRLIAAAKQSTGEARDTSAWVRTVLARPLFTQGRRPPKRAAGAKFAGGDPLPRLSGIMVTPFGRRAIFAATGLGKPQVLAEGGAIGDTTVRTIKPDRVVLASGTVLTPSYDKNRPTVFNPGAIGGLPPGAGLPVVPNPAFQNPNFANPAFPPPAYPNPILQNPAFPNQAQPPQPSNGDDQPDNGQPPQAVFRGPGQPERSD